MGKEENLGREKFKRMKSKKSGKKMEGMEIGAKKEEEREREWIINERGKEKNEKKKKRKKLSIRKEKCERKQKERKGNYWKEVKRQVKEEKR